MKKQPIIIVTGHSGSGKSTALATFEDAGFYCIDNLPVTLVADFMAQSQPPTDSAPIAGWAFGMDLRDKRFLTHHPTLVDNLKRGGHKVVTVFLDADEQVLLRRYNQTRRHHPMGRCDSLLEAIQAEKQQMQPLLKKADHVIDTSGFSVHELKFAILNIAQRYTAVSGMAINVVSFGFKYGKPFEADLLMDVRFLKNPYFVTELKLLDGEDPKIKDFVANDPETRRFLDNYMALLSHVVPLYEKEGKAYLTIAIGCTGGRHRSVVVAREIYDHLRCSHATVRLIHRDINLN
ncbi:MAG: RNase adapter RapZ [Desulfatitalea sp.]|nr:RNase adapter RapZ [Desulfatitalea sp.]NNK01803.1 RNase adapter RapZ [Desulfatitalea sp.]